MTIAASFTFTPTRRVQHPGIDGGDPTHTTEVEVRLADKDICTYIANTGDGQKAIEWAMEWVAETLRDLFREGPPKTCDCKCGAEE